MRREETSHCLRSHQSVPTPGGVQNARIIGVEQASRLERRERIQVRRYRDGIRREARFAEHVIHPDRADRCPRQGITGRVGAGAFDQPHGAA